MKGCFTFQWRWCFSDGGASFLSVEGEGAPHRGASVLVGMFSKKIVRWAWGRTSPPPMPFPTLPLWETLCVDTELLLCMLSSAVHVLCMFCFTNITNV